MDEGSLLIKLCLVGRQAERKIYLRNSQTDGRISNVSLKTRYGPPERVRLPEKALAENAKRALYNLREEAQFVPKR